MNITGTHINYFRVCKRKLWLFAHEIQMEQTSDLVADGKVIEEESYLQRNQKYEQIELSIDYEGDTLTGKIDFYDPNALIVHETKRSNKVEKAHIWQVKFYLWLLKMENIPAKKGVIEYPKLRSTEDVFLSEDDIKYLQETVRNVQECVQNEVCPPVIHAKICKSCSYYDFCYVTEGAEG